MCPSPAPSPPSRRRVGIIGGGTAGYFAALALGRRFPDLDVTLVESSSIPIIGVGEASTTLMPPFLHQELGLDVVALFEAVRPTFKLGIRFEWGPRAVDHFNYPFGSAEPLLAHAFDGALTAQSLTSLLMDAGRFPILRAPDGTTRSLLPSTKLAYHLDNAPFVAFLRAEALGRGVRHLDATVVAAIPNERGGIASVRTADGEDLAFDLFVDATGFRSLLLDKTLGDPFTSYADSLFCDRAIVGAVPREGPSQPYTTAETMDAGWCWRIPVRAEDHRGYVFSSRFLSDDAAYGELRAKNPTLGEPRTVHFRSGRHDRFWVDNTVAIGNAYAFVEPLESTGLHMIIVELGYLLAGLESERNGDGTEAPRAFANDAVREHWDQLRWFLSAHYRFNERLDTPFWREARSSVDVSGLAEELARFTAEGPFAESAGLRYRPGDAVFGYSGLMTLLLGQGVPAGQSALPAGRPAWEERKQERVRLAERALSQDDALALLDRSPDLLRELAESDGSWVRGAHERVHVSTSERVAARPFSGAHHGPPRK